MLLQSENSYFIIDSIKMLNHMNPEIIGHLFKKAKSTIIIKIRISSSRLFYKFVISIAGYSQMKY